MRQAARDAGAALVTGASSGLGEAFARRLAHDGRDVVLVARRADRLEALKTDLERAHGVRAHALPCDLADAPAVSDLPQQLAERQIDVGLIVHAAGFATFGRFDAIDVDTSVRMIDLHCRAPVFLTRAFLPAMLARRSGAVIFVASIGVYQPDPLFAVYGGTKAFLLLFGEALWAELRGTGVDVIVVSPGYTHTEFHDAAAIQAHPVSGWSTPEDVVDACFRGLGRRPSVIPGFGNRAVAFLARLSPRGLMARASYSLSLRRHTPTSGR